MTTHECFFCNKQAQDAKHMISVSSVVNICDECVDQLTEVLASVRTPDVLENVSGSLNPRHIKELLDRVVIGQEEAKKVLAVEVYNHYKRINNTDKNIQKSNILMIGDSGTGKTLLVQTLSKILDLPMVIADMSLITAAGYVGQDIESVLQQLVIAADGDIQKAEQGIVLLDECYPGYVEVYTEDGFVRFDELTEDHKVLQYDNFGNLSFVIPDRYIKRHFTGNLVRAYNDQFEHISTPRHNRVFINQQGKLIKQTAEDRTNCSNYMVPTSGNYISHFSEFVNTNIIKLWAAIIVLEKNIKNNCLLVKLTENSKKQKLLNILISLNVCIEYNDDEWAISLKDLSMILPNFDVLSRQDIFRLNTFQREIFIEELIYWSVMYPDQTINKHTKEIVLRDSHHIEVIQECCHLTNLLVDITGRKDREYRLTIEHKYYKTHSGIEYEDISHDGDVYCVEVSSGMILIRCNDTIQISGNCDKIAKRNLTSSTEKDPGGEGVQQGLLKILEGHRVPLKLDGMKLSQKESVIDTTNILFICAGAFFGLDKILEKNSSEAQQGIGFSAVVEKPDISVKDITEQDIIEYGFIPEFIGRLPVIVRLNKLTKDDYRRILIEPSNSVIKQYQNLLELDGFNLEFTSEYLDSIVEQVYNTSRGARALRTEIEKTMRNVIFELDFDSLEKDIKI